MTDTRRFDEIAATWDADPMRARLAGAIADAVERQVVLAPTMDVLDFGCGTGLLSMALLPKVRSVTSADTSSGMLGVLEGKVRAQRLTSVKTVLLRQEDDYALSGEHDLIVSSMTLHHVADLGRLFARFRRAPAPGRSHRARRSGH